MLGAGGGGVCLGLLAGTGDSMRVPLSPCVAVGWWAVRVCACERGGPPLQSVCVNESAPGKHGCVLAYVVSARVRALRYLSFRELCAGRCAARRPGLGGSAASAGGSVPRPTFRVRRCLSASRPRGVSAARQPGRRAVSARWCVPGPRAPAPSLPSPLARSQTQIKHFLPLSSYPAGRAARALPLPAPSLPLAVSQSLRSLRRPGGCEAGAPAPRPAMSPPL